MKKLLLVLILLSGCSTMRGAYQADVVIDNKRVGCVRYEGGVDTTGFAIACGLTGIFYGGACWAYLSMPHDDHVRVMRNQVKAKLEEGGTKDFQLARESSARLSWNNGETVYIDERNVQTCDTIRIMMPGQQQSH